MRKCLRRMPCLISNAVYQRTERINQLTILFLRWKYAKQLQKKKSPFLFSKDIYSLPVDTLKEPSGFLFQRLLFMDVSCQDLHRQICSGHNCSRTLSAVPPWPWSMTAPLVSVPSAWAPPSYSTCVSTGDVLATVKESTISPCAASADAWGWVKTSETIKP